MTQSFTKFTKYTSIALLLGSSIASAKCGDDDGERFTGNLFGYERCADDEKRLFVLRGNVGSFTKAGFNGVRADPTNSIYPTESFSTMFGEVNGIFHVHNVLENDFIGKLEVGVGAAANGLVYDSTKFDHVSAPTSGGLSSGSGLNNQYVGSWAGYLGTSPASYNSNRHIMLHNAYIDLALKNFVLHLGGNEYESGSNIKLGRYESSMDYHSGYTQGFNLDWFFKYGDLESHADNKVKLWWFSSFGRAFAYSQWFLDFYAVKTSDSNGDGKVDVSYGIHSFGADVTYGGITDTEDGLAYGDTLFVRPFMYFYPGLYEAPGAKAVYERQFGNGLGFKVTAQGFALHVNRQYTTAANVANKRYDEIIDEWSGNLNLIAQGNIYNYNVRIGYYENFGAANSHFGTYGNPMGLDFWTGSVYDIGASISDIINRNARSGYLSGGGYYDLKYGTLSWDLLGRITRSPRSDEESIALYVKHAFHNGLALGVKLEWFRDTTKVGYNPGATAGGTALTSARTDDRSHAFFTIDYSF